VDDRTHGPASGGPIRRAAGISGLIVNLLLVGSTNPEDEFVEVAADLLLTKLFCTLLNDHGG
jgi:hypothetical protein